jgi:hypothetical protein
MSKIYEAIYEDGHLQRLGTRPGAGRHRLRVTIIDDRPPQHSPQEVHRMLEATRGAWGRGRPLRTLTPRSTGCERSGIERRGAHRLDARL